jgi:hypothetical protein
LKYLTSLKLGVALVCFLVLAAGCDSDQPTGPLQSPVPATRAANDARVFPTGVAVPTLTTIAEIALNSTPVTVNDDLATPDLDACTLLTEQEAEVATGLKLQRADFVDTSTPGAKCRYETEGTSVSLKVLASVDEAMSARVWQGRYNLYLHPQLSSVFQYAPGVGDAAFIYVPRSSASEFMTQRFWYVVAKRGTMYIELLWLTDKEDPTAALIEMTSKVVSRL